MGVPNDRESDIVSPRPRRLGCEETSASARARRSDQVISRNSCVCARCGCVGTTRTLKPYMPLSAAGTAMASCLTEPLLTRWPRDHSSRVESERLLRRDGVECGAGRGSGIECDFASRAGRVMPRLLAADLRLSAAAGLQQIRRRSDRILFSAYSRTRHAGPCRARERPVPKFSPRGAQTLPRG